MGKVSPPPPLPLTLPPPPPPWVSRIRPLRITSVCRLPFYPLLGNLSWKLNLIQTSEKLSLSQAFPELLELPRKVK